MKYVQLTIILLVGGLFSAVQAASPKPSGYLSDYKRLTEGEHLEAYWIDLSQIERVDEPKILLGEISLSGVKDHKDVKVSDCVAWLKDALLKGVVITDSNAQKYRLDLAITHLDPGSAAKRILAGEFGMGHALLQIEGKVVYIESGEVVAEFAERRRSSGAIGIEDLDGHGGRHIFEHLVNLISADINSELLASFIKR